MTTHPARLSARVAALLAAIATTAAVAACTSTPASDGHTDHTHDATSAQAGSDTPAANADPDAVEHNAADEAFATHMIPHHEQAVALSDLVPSRSSDPAVVELAAAIAKAQQPEIETMKGFLTQWNGGAAPAPGGHEGHDMGGMQMQGMVDDATMTRLESLKGKEFDTLWLQSMIGHHEGAIDMAKTELADGANAAAKDLAQQIVDAQQAEIDQMKQMMGG